jgi:uncharacterized protein (TIGR02453 family)
MGSGLWHPAGPTLAAIRSALVEDPDGWRRASDGLNLGGDSLKRAPRGFDPDHPLIEDLKRKDFVCFTESDQKAACSPGFVDVFADNCRSASGFMGFLTEAVGLEY